MTTRKADGARASVKESRTSGSDSPAVPPAPVEDVEALRADIERTRADLGDTVEALADKVDVKARARRAVRSVRTQTANGAATARRWLRDKPVPVAAVTAGVLAIALAVVGRRFGRRHSRRRSWRP